MPEQTSNVSSVLSPLLKNAKPGRPETRAGAETVSKNGSAFSTNLNQAHQQQLNNMQAPMLQRGTNKDSSQATGAVSNHSVPVISNVQASESDKSRLLQDLASDDSAAIDVAVRSNPVEAGASAAPLLTATDQQLPGAGKQASALSSRQLPPVIGSSTDSANPVSNSAATPTPAPAQLLEQQSVTATAVVPAETPAAVVSRDLNQVRQQLLNKTQPELLQRSSGNGSSQATGVVLNHSVPSISSAQASQSDGGLHYQDLADGDSVVVDVADRPIPVEAEESAAPLLAATVLQVPRAVEQAPALTSKHQRPVLMSATDNAIPVSNSASNPTQLLEQRSAAATAVVLPVSSAIAHSVNGTVGEVVTPAALAGRSRQLASGMQVTSAAEPSAAQPSAAQSSAAQLSAANGLVANAKPSVAKGLGATKGRLPEEPANSFVVRESATKHDATLATAAKVVGRLSNLNSDAVSPGTVATQKTSDIGVAQAVQPSLSIKGDSLPADDIPLASERMSSMESLKGFTDSNATVHQRIATTEAVLLQMALEADGVSVKMPADDNLLQAISGGTMAAPVVTQSVPVPGPIIQAPLNVPLASADAETALAGNIKWMTSEGVKNAVMTVTPHGMGPISVKIAIDGTQMDVSIIAPQNSTRDALESMLPRLREQLTLQGHETVKVDVSDGKSEQSRSGSGQSFAESRNPTGAFPQDNQSNSRNHGEKTANGRTDDLEVDSESFMAEDLQRVAARAIGEAGNRPVFDAYV